jgi:hypothetical protein
MDVVTVGYHQKIRVLIPEQLEIGVDRQAEEERPKTTTLARTD